MREHDGKNFKTESFKKRCEVNVINITGVFSNAAE